MNFSYYSRAMLLAAGVCAALSAAQAAPDAHDFGIEIEKPPASKPKTDKPKPDKPKLTAPKPTSVPQSVEAVSVEAARVPMLLGQMEAGQLTPEAAWKSGALTREGLLFLFERHLDVWKLTDAQSNNGLSLKLAGLLVKETPEGAKLSRKVRLWLGEFYRVQKDERAAALFEGVLDEFKAPVKSKDPVLFLATERLAWHYRDTGQHEKAALTWLRLEALATDAHWQADGVMEAAREYVAAGEADKAQGLYARVAAYGDGWLTGMALYDQGSALIEAGQHEEARLLLKTQIKGRGAESIKVGLLSLLAYSYYRRGEWEEAQLYSLQAVKQFEVLTAVEKSKQQREERRAQEIPRWIAVWKKEPIVCLPRKLPHVGTLSRSELEKLGQPCLIRLSIHTFQPVALVAMTDHEKLTSRIEENSRGGDNALYFQREVAVEVPPEMLNENFDFTLTITSPAFPDFQAQVPIHVEVPTP